MHNTQLGGSVWVLHSLLTGTACGPHYALGCGICALPLMPAGFPANVSICVFGMQGMLLSGADGLCCVRVAPFSVVCAASDSCMWLLCLWLTSARQWRCRPSQGYFWSRLFCIRSCCWHADPLLVKGAAPLCICYHCETPYMACLPVQPLGLAGDAGILLGGSV